MVRRFRESAPGKTDGCSERRIEPHVYANHVYAGMLAPLAIPVSVEDVARVALAAALAKEEVVSRDSPILSDADILSISTLLK